MALFEADIIGKLNLTEFDRQIKGIKSTPIELTNIRISNASLAQSIQAELSKHTFDISIGRTNFNQITSQARQAASQVANTFTSSLNKIKLINGGIDNVHEMLQGAGFNKSSISAVTQDLNNMSIAVSKISTTMRHNGNIRMNIQGSDELGRAVRIIREYDSETGNVKNSSKTFGQVFSRTMKTMSADTVQFKATLLDGKMSAWLEKNSKATKLYGDRIASLQTQLRGLNASDPRSGAQLTSIERQFKLINSAAETAGVTGKSVIDKFKGTFSRVTRYFSSSVLIYKTIAAVREGIKTIKELDTALVDLQKTTSATPGQLRSFYYEANDIAKQYGATTQSIIQSAADWSRLGYNIDDSRLMSKMSSMFSSISPGMDVDSSTEGLVSVMKAYKIEADDVLDGIMSKVNIIGNNFALSNKDLVEGLKLSSAAMSSANNSLEQTIALITAGNEIIQDPNKVGNALRTNDCAYVQKCA